MSKRTVYDVSPDGEGWKVQERGGERARKHSTKDEALAEARELASASKPSQVVIRTSDGRIEEERTYQDDPYPPEG